MIILTPIIGRRRKIRCTYDPTRPKLCNECYVKGTSCVDQETAQVAPNVGKLCVGEQTYSLRERVAALEHLVGDVMKRLEDTEAELIGGRTDSPSGSDQCLFSNGYSQPRLETDTNIG